MADNKERLDARDPDLVSGSETYEIQYLQDLLGFSRDQIRMAMEAVGNDRERISEYLHNKFK